MIVSSEVGIALKSWAVIWERWSALFGQVARQTGAGSASSSTRLFIELQLIKRIQIATCFCRWCFACVRNARSTGLIMVRKKRTNEAVTEDGALYNKRKRPNDYPYGPSFDANAFDTPQDENDKEEVHSVNAGCTEQDRNHQQKSVEQASSAAAATGATTSDHVNAENRDDTDSLLYSNSDSDRDSIHSAKNDEIVEPEIAKPKSSGSRATRKRILTFLDAVQDPNQDLAFEPADEVAAYLRSVRLVLPLVLLTVVRPAIFRLLTKTA